MPWDYERIEEDGIEYIEAFHTDNPEERHRVYKFYPDQPIIEFYPKKTDGYPIDTILLEGFSFLPDESKSLKWFKRNLPDFCTRINRGNK